MDNNCTTFPARVVTMRESMCGLETVVSGDLCFGACICNERMIDVSWVCRLPAACKRCGHVGYLRASRHVRHARVCYGIDKCVGRRSKPLYIRTAHTIMMMHTQRARVRSELLSTYHPLVLPLPLARPSPAERSERPLHPAARVHVHHLSHRNPDKPLPDQNGTPMPVGVAVCPGLDLASSTLSQGAARTLVFRENSHVLTDRCQALSPTTSGGAA